MRRGHCVVVSGPRTPPARRGWRRAARLRIGAGLVSVAAQGDAVAVNAAHLTAIMVKPFEGARGLAELLSDKRLNAVVIGPGLGVGGETRELVMTALASGAASWCWMPMRSPLSKTIPRRCSPRSCARRRVLTPHEGEFERLFPGLLRKAQSKLEAARAAAARPVRWCCSRATTR